jgi:UDP-3-O-[3-hydroxymyristoyl] glucosamine N-acyltransferase
MHTIQSISQHVTGTVSNLQNTEIKGVSSLEKAGKGEISFFQDPRFENRVYESNASAILVSENFKPKKPISAVLIKVSDVRKSLAEVLELFKPNDIFDRGKAEFVYVADTAEIDESALLGNFTHIADHAFIGANTKIGSQVFIGQRVKIGKNVHIFPGVKIYHDCTIGDDTVIHSNVVIGSDGFGFDRKENGAYDKIPQVGQVKIGSNVEIGANTVIDRSTFGSTVIENGVKLDNLIQVAHNVTIGSNTVIAAQTGIAGSVTLGRDCVIGGQSAFVPHISVADGSQFQGKSGVSHSIKKPGGKYYGYPAINFKDYIRSFAVFKVLPKLEKRVRDLEKSLENNKSA